MSMYEYRKPQQTTRIEQPTTQETTRHERGTKDRSRESSDKHARGTYQRTSTEGTTSRWSDPHFEQARIESSSSGGSVHITINGSADRSTWAINNRDVTQTQAQSDFKNEIEEATSKFRKELQADRDAFLKSTFPGWQRPTAPAAAVTESMPQHFAAAPTEQQIRAVHQAVRSAVADLKAELSKMQLSGSTEDDIRHTAAEIDYELGRTAHPDRGRVGEALDRIIDVLHESRHPEDSSAGEKASAAEEQLKAARLQLDTLNVV